MRLIKIFGLTAVATMLATGLVGAQSASAEVTTELCKVHVGLECPEGQGVVEDLQELEKGTDWKLLFNVLTISCTSALTKATTLSVEEQFFVQTTELKLSKCGTNEKHDNCSVTAVKLPLFELLKTGLDEGLLWAYSGRLSFSCYFGGTPFKCEYDLGGMQLAMGGQHTTASASPMFYVSGGFYCPDEAFLDYLLVTEEEHFILG